MMSATAPSAARSGRMVGACAPAGVRVTRPSRACGAALLAALLTVALVATLASAAMWRHWQSVEQEQAEYTRQQARWMLAGALGWARLILREDAKDNQVDHLSEPWAVPLRDARLDQFLLMDPSIPRDTAVASAILNGRILDAQARLNFANLVGDDGKVSVTDLADWVRLFRILHLPEQEIIQAARLYRMSLSTDSSPAALATRPLPPRRWADWMNLGLSASTLEALRPHAVYLPERTKVNVNTATPEVLQASITGLDAADAQQIVQSRSLKHFSGLSDLLSRHPIATLGVQDAKHSVSSRYFLVLGQLRLQGQTLIELNLVQRDSSEIITVRRQGDCIEDIALAACTLYNP